MAERLGRMEAEGSTAWTLKSPRPLVDRDSWIDIQPVDRDVVRLTEIDSKNGGTILEDSRSISLTEHAENGQRGGPVEADGILCIADVGEDEPVWRWTKHRYVPGGVGCGEAKDIIRD